MASLSGSLIGALLSFVESLGGVDLDFLDDDSTSLPLLAPGTECLLPDISSYDL